MPRAARWLVAVILVLLLVPGIVGFDAWPLTGWRLFSLKRDATQTFWVLDAVEGDGTERTVSLEDLPLGYRHAEWPLSDLLGASTERREDVCQALLAAIVERHPSTVELRLKRDRQELVEESGDWTVVHDEEEFHTCQV